MHYPQASLTLSKAFMAWFTGMLLWSGTTSAQTSPAEDEILPARKVTLEGITVTANKFSESTLRLAQKIDVLDSNDIAGSFTSNTANLLEQSSKVFVQKSQQGGGSPVIRGFEASRVLLMVDGVRMNNAIYRSGHLQNIITVDDDVLERVEILNGPASTIYGSDALGGVIHLRTIQARLREDGNSAFRVNGRVATRFSSAAGERTTNGRINIASNRFASLTAFSYSDFGDLRSGNIRNPFYGDFGKRSEYVERINGVDSIVKNADVNRQKFSGYQQYDLLQKFMFAPRNNRRHQLNFQYSTTGNVPRYDRLTDTRSGKLRWAEWNYGPQERLLTAYQLEAKELHGFFDELLVGAAWQKIQESRIQRALGKDDQENRQEDLHICSYTIDLRKSKGRHELNVGTDAQFNFLKSTAFVRNIVTGIQTQGLDTRYPNGKNRMHYLGLYAQHLFKIAGNKLVLNDGLRINYSSLNATLNPTISFPLPYNDLSQNTLSVSGNLSLIGMPDDRTKISGGIATGFRAPNIDDMAKIFESAAGAQLVVPNPDLKPEQTINFDLGVDKIIAQSLRISINGFYTLMRQAIVSDRFQLNGQDSVWYGGKLTQVVASQNKASARIHGLQVSLSYPFTEWLSGYCNAAYTYGRFTDASGKQVSLDHIPPFYGKTGLRYATSKTSADCYVLYNGWKHLADYNPYGEDNLQYATAQGMPSWYTLNASVQHTFNEHVRVQAALENILDKNYRTFASGINGAGRSLILKMTAAF